MTRICIVTESNPPFESFVKAHIDYLKGDIFVLYGSTLPSYDQNGHCINYYPNGLKKIFYKILGKSYNSQIDGIKNYFIKNKIQVVLAEYGTTGAQVFSICEALKIPIVIHFHGRDSSLHFAIEYHKDLYPRMFSYASKIIAVANDMKTQLVQLGANALKVIVSPCAPNASFFDVNPTYSNNIFLVVGRFVDKKAPYYTIEAFKRIVAIKPEAKMVMIGEGYLLNTCKNLVKVWNLEDSVVFTGKITHDKIIEYFNTSFCFLQHSITADDGDSEGSPVSVMEASAAGLPVIATKHMGIKESVKHGQTGFLVEEGDVIGMHNFMLQLYNNRELAADLGLNGRKYIQANFSMGKHISMIQSAIDSSLSQ